VVGLQLRFVEAVERALGEASVLLEARTIGEVGLISELFEGEIDLVVVNGAATRPKSLDRIRTSRPRAEFLDVSGANGESGIDPLNSANLESRVRAWLGRTVAYAVASGSGQFLG
jgi:hypothetical protein